jgi:acyl carrier protein
MESTLDIVKQLIAKKLEIDVAEIQADSRLTEIGLDSLDTFDIIFEAEDRFGIKVPNEQVDVNTIQDMANLLDQLLQAKA